MQIDGIGNTKKETINPPAGGENSSKGEKTALNVAEEVKGFIKAEYPQIADSHAMRLAVLLTKTQIQEVKHD